MARKAVAMPGIYKKPKQNFDPDFSHMFNQSLKKASCNVGQLISGFFNSDT